MMFKIFHKLKKNRAASAIEYMFVMFFIASVLLVFQDYIARGLSGYWKKAGDSWGHGKQFEPDPNNNNTLECHYDSRIDVGDLEVFTRPGWLVPCCTIDPARSCAEICDTCGSKPTGAMNVWVDSLCFRENCDCDLPKDHSLYDEICRMCIEGCRSVECGANMCWDLRF